MTDKFKRRSTDNENWSVCPMSPEQIYTVIQREIASNDWAAYKAWMIANLPGDGHAGLRTTRPTYVFKDQ